MKENAALYYKNFIKIIETNIIGLVYVIAFLHIYSIIFSSLFYIIILLLKICLCLTKNRWNITGDMCIPYLPYHCNVIFFKITST